MSAKYVTGIVSLKYKDTTFFDNFNVGACQLIVYYSYQFDLSIRQKSREKIVDFINNDEKYIFFPLEDKDILKSPNKCALSLDKIDKFFMLILNLCLKWLIKIGLKYFI